MEETQRTRIQPRRRRRPFLPAFLGVIFLMSICGAIVLVLLGLSQLPRITEQQFGPPDAALGERQRLIISLRLLLNQQNLTEPVNARGQPIDFKILLGETVPTISGRLQQQGIIRNSAAFRYFLIYSGLDKGIQAGEYRLSPALNAMQIAQALQDATPEEVSFAILPGWRLEEIAAALPTSGLQVEADEFLRLVKHPSGLDHPAAEYPSLEGFLYPDVYRIKRDVTAEQLVMILLDHFDAQVDENLRSTLQTRGYDMLAAVTLASIIQREAVVAQEQPMIASVFDNRLAAGMKLDSDPTVQYALGYNAQQQTWWTNPLSAADLQINSPYNTYIQNGLPPGPICNPTLSSLRAVAFPASTPYYYFRARCDQSGRHVFARTYEEHLQNGCD